MASKYNDIKPGLYIVSTPIGNLEDVSKRLINILSNSEYILCEDTRITSKLLNHLNIKKKLISFHIFNEDKKIDQIINHLQENKILSLVSDAGTPTLSDPGRYLVSKCYEHSIKVIPIPGPSAITCAISASGFGDQFHFCGFLPKKQKEIEERLNSLRLTKGSLIFFFPARDLEKNSQYFLKVFPNSIFFIAREMTKIHETYIRDKMQNIKKYYDSNKKGEMTFIIDNSFQYKDEINLDAEIQLLIGKMSSKDIAEYLSKKLEINKKSIYQRVIEFNE